MKVDAVAVDARAAGNEGMDWIAARHEAFGGEAGSAGSAVLVELTVDGVDASVVVMLLIGGDVVVVVTHGLRVLVELTVDGVDASVVVTLLIGGELVALVVTHGLRVLVSRLEWLASGLIGSRRLSCGLGKVGPLLRRGAVGRSSIEPAAPTVDSEIAGVGRLAVRRGRGVLAVLLAGAIAGRSRSIASPTESR